MTSNLVEVYWSIGKIEKYHALMRCAYKIIYIKT